MAATTIESKMTVRAYDLLSGVGLLALIAIPPGYIAEMFAFKVHFNSLIVAGQVFLSHQVRSFWLTICKDENIFSNYRYIHNYVRAFQGFCNRDAKLNLVSRSKLACLGSYSAVTIRMKNRIHTATYSPTLVRPSSPQKENLGLWLISPKY